MSCGWLIMSYLLNIDWLRDDESFKSLKTWFGVRDAFIKRITQQSIL